jgi:hypothetical protein
VLFGPLKSYIKNEISAYKIIRYSMARLVGFAWNTAASVCVGVSAFGSTDIYPFNRNRVPKYLFSVSYTNETVTSIEILCPNKVPVFVPSTSVTNSQNVLPVLAEGSISNVSTIISPDFACRPLNKISQVPEIRIFPTKEASNIEEKRKKQGGNKVKEERNGKCKQSKYFRSTTSKNADKESYSYSRDICRF